MADGSPGDSDNPAPEMGDEQSPEAEPDDPSRSEGPKIPRLPEVESVAANSLSTEQAYAEERSLGSYLTPEDLAQIAANDEHHRDRRFRDAVERIAICSLYLGYVTLSVLALVWAAHLVMPTCYRWLSSEDLTHIQTLLTAGVLVGAVGGHFKKRMGNQAGKPD